MRDKILIKLKGLLDNLSEIRDDEKVSMHVRLSVSECQKLTESIYEDIKQSELLEGASPKESTEDKKEAQNSSEPKIKLLIVDDDEDTQKMLLFTLKRRGFEVISETNPVEAFKKLEEIKAEVLLLDLMMPGMSGFEFLRHLQKHPLYGKIKVLVGSARNFEKDRISVLEEGAHDFIAKPYNINELILKLRSLLRS